MAPKWNNIFLQGFVGMGLVGYNTIKTLIDNYNADIYKDYAEFFPNLTLIDNGRIENQCARIFKKELSKRVFHFLNGPQPRGDEMTSFFLQKIITDIAELNNAHKIDLFVSFGALVNKNLSYSDYQDISYDSKEDLAEKIIALEIEKDRKLYLATTGNPTFDDFVKDVGTVDEIVKETQGIINGLNGVLPAMVGERLKIPTVTIMIETTGTDVRTNNFPILAQFLGLLATKKGLIFLERMFDLDIKLETKIDAILDELKATAKQEIVNFFNKDYSAERSRESEFRNDKMYT